MAWHIYNNKEEYQPLCWEVKALSFDTYEDAKFFLDSLLLCFDSTESWESFMSGVVINEDTLYYDYGTIDATGKYLALQENGELGLCKVKEDI